MDKNLNITKLNAYKTKTSNVYAVILEGEEVILSLHDIKYETLSLKTALEIVKIESDFMIHELIDENCCILYGDEDITYIDNWSNIPVYCIQFGKNHLNYVKSLFESEKLPYAISYNEEKDAYVLCTSLNIEKPSTLSCIKLCFNQKNSL